LSKTSNFNLRIAMYTSERLNRDELLLPISDSAPAGYDLRQNEIKHSLYYQIKNIRNTARTQERKHVENSEGKHINPSDWKPVVELAKKVLIQESKDLEIASWLCEGLVRINGFAGLYDGLKLIKELIANFSPDFYPRPDEEGIITQLGALSGLAGTNSPGTLVAPIKSCFITNGLHTGQYAVWQYEEALELNKIKDKQHINDRISRGAVILDDIEKSARETESKFFIELESLINDCLGIIDELHTELESKQPVNNISLMYLRYALEECLNAMRYLTRNINKVTQPIFSQSNGPYTNTEGSTIVNSSRPKMDISLEGLDRDTALNLLSTVAEFFRKTEMHSPISNTLDQVIRWANLSLSELLPELMIDDKAYFYYCKLTGINPIYKNQPNQSITNNGYEPEDLEFLDDDQKLLARNYQDRED